MTTGQPIRFNSDRNKFNNEYAEALQLQINLNQTNLEANRLYNQTGQLPASTQMMDTRSSEEKLMDIHYLRQQIVSDLSPIAEPAFANAVVTGVTNSPLNVDNTLFRYLAQNGRAFAEALSKKYKFGIAGDANDVATMVQFLEDAYVKTKNSFQSIKGYINSNTNEGNKSRSNILSANDTDNIKTEIKDIIKRLSFARIPNQLADRVMDLVAVLTYLDKLLPTSDQMQKVIQDITNSMYNDIDIPGEGEVYVVFDILKSKLPKLSSVQTLIDRLERSFTYNDTRQAIESINGILKLFSAINDDQDVKDSLVQFHDVYINRANQQIQQENYVNRIQQTQTIQAENAQERAERNAQRVYIINPPGADAVNVQGLNMAAGVPANVQNIAAAQVQPDMPANDVFITQQVDNLSQQELDDLYNRIPNSRMRIPLTPALQGMFNLPNASPNQKRYACIQALVSAVGPNGNYDPQNGIGNFNIQGLGLKKPKKGRGLYSPFGDSEINHKNLENNILTLRRKSKTNYMDLPSKHISKHMKNIIHNIVGGKIANYEDLHNLSDEEKNYLHKVVSKSKLHDRLSVPAPSKDQADKDAHQFEVMRGEIMAGNDSKELVKKFKILTMKLTRQGLLPKNEVMDLFEDLVNLGY